MDAYTQVFYPLIYVYIRLEPDPSSRLLVFKLPESFINVSKRIYTDKIDFTRQITRQIPF